MSRAMDLAVFMLLMNSAFYIIGSLKTDAGQPVFWQASVYAPAKNYNDSFLNETIAGMTLTEKKSTAISIPGLSTLYDIGQFIYNSFVAFANIFIYATYGIPKMLSSEPFKFPGYLVTTLSTIITIIYAAGVMAFLRGQEP